MSTPSSDPVQRRTLGVLISTQVLGGVGVTSGVAVGALLAADVSGSETYAGLGGTFQVLGGAVAAAILARVMGRRGRRPGLALGYAIGVLGGVTVIVAAVIGSFALLLVGSLLFGAATASNSQARFAAADLAGDARRGRHLSLVVWATTIGAVVGPNLTGVGARLGRTLGIPDLAGPFALSVTGFALAAAVLTLALRPDPLLEARRRQREVSGDTSDHVHRGFADGLRAIREHRAGLAGIVTMALGHAVMVSLMVMTPLHMRHGDADLEVIGVVISLHIVGMYALSPVTGWATDRLGGRAVALVGSGVLGAATLLAATTHAGASASLTAALVLLGLGWSCTLVSGSTLITNAIPLRDRAGAQGVADVAMGLAGGLGGALAGVVVDRAGYGPLAISAAVVAGAIAVAAVAIKH